MHIGAKNLEADCLPYLSKMKVYSIEIQIFGYLKKIEFCICWTLATEKDSLF